MRSENHFNTHTMIGRAKEHAAQRKELMRASRKSDETEGYIDRYIHDPIAIVLSKFFIRLHISPNTITLLSLLFGVTGGLLFAPKDLFLNICGVLLQILGLILDCSDGQVARLTGNSTQFGRVLDGCVDSLNFSAVYIGIGLRMMNESIPFTNGIRWGCSIWLVVLFCAIYSHKGQSRMADCYRVTHLFFLNGKDRSELTSSASLKKEYQALPPGAPLYQKLYLRVYTSHTAKQERRTPKLQQLLRLANRCDDETFQRLALYYTGRSRQYIELTNVLTISLHAYLMYLLVLLDLPVVYFPVVILGLEALNVFMIHKYEQIAEAGAALFSDSEVSCK